MTEPVLTDDEHDTVRAWVHGIDQGIWNPTPATKRHLADVLRRVVLNDNARRSEAGA